MRTPRDLATLTATERAALRPDDRIVTTDGTIHLLSIIIVDQTVTTGEYTKISGRSVTADAWLNLLTGHQVGAPAAEEELQRVAAYYDATGRAADLPAARRLAEHHRYTVPEQYAATLARITAHAAENQTAGNAGR